MINSIQYFELNWWVGVFVKFATSLLALLAEGYSFLENVRRYVFPNHLEFIDVTLFILQQVR